MWRRRCQPTWGEASHGLCPETWQKNWHVTRSVCRPCQHLAFLRSALILPTHHSQFKFQRNFNEEPCGPMAISPLQVGPPTGTRREPAPGLHRVARPTLNGVTRPLTSSPPTCASHTVSTEHDHDSQRPVIPVETFQPDRRCENAGMTSAY